MPKYRLQTLLDIREKEKKDKEEALAAAKKNLQMEQLKLQELRKQLQDKCDARDAKREEMTMKTTSGELGINGYVNAERYLKRVDKEIEEFEETEIKEQIKVISFAEQEVEWANEEMLEAMQACKALEKHKEKWDEQVKKERAQKEAMAQEEIAQTLYTFKDRQ